MITVNKANPTQGEITSSLTGSTGDGAGLNFDGAAGSVAFTPVDLGTDFSFEFVIKQDSNTDAYIVDFSGGGINRFIIGRNGNELQMYSSTSWDTFGVAPLDDGKVHHLVITVSDTLNATLYDNGNQIATLSLNANYGLDAATSATFGSRFNAASSFFNGTIYRARFWNRTLSSAEVQTAFERADVDFADQYGSQTSKILNGTAWTGASGSTPPNSWTAGNAATYTIDSSSGSGSEPALKIQRSTASNPYIYQTFTAVVGKKYRLTYRAKNVDATHVRVFVGSTAAGNEYGVTNTTATSWTDVEETFTATTTTFSVAVQVGTSTGTQSGYIDSLTVEQVGVVTDLDLAFANPLQSLTVQDRAGSADGTCSASGVTQVQPVVQGNLTSLAVSSATARTPADGAITSDTLGVGVAPVNKLSVEGYNTTTTVGTDVDVHIEGGGAANHLTQLGFGYNAQNTSWKPPVIIGSKTGSASGQTEADFFVATRSGTTGTDAPATRLTIDSSVNAALGDSTPSSPGGAARFLEISGSSASLVLTDSDAATWEWISAGGNLKAAKDGTDKVTVDTNGNVGIACDPANPLQVEKASAATSISNAQNDNALKLSNYSTAADGQFVSLGLSVAGTSGASADSVIAGFRDGAGDSSLRFYTENGNTLGERMRISSTGQVNISNTSDPTLKLHNTTGSTNDTAAVVFGVSSGTADGPRVESKRQSDGTIDLNLYTAGATSQTNAAAAMVIDGGSNLATFSAGVNLGNTASATATTLDGYEEGTWTCQLNGVTGTHTGYYMRVGSLVHWLVKTAMNTSTAVAATFSGLPFTVANEHGPFVTTHNTWAASAGSGYVEKTTTSGKLITNGSTSTATAISSSSFKYCYMGGVYQTTDAF